MGGVDSILELLSKGGSRSYGGEPVSQLEHALQCAYLAEREHASDQLVAAALLHDLGHLLHELGDDATQRGVDDRHQFRALHLLRRHFGEGVLQPILLHVDAKRYLCWADPAYFDSLTPASKASLDLQGGPFDADQAKQFILQPHGRDAARLRTWDDRAKVPGTPTPDLGHYQHLLTRCRPCV